MNNYTLEKHLRSLSETDKDYELLRSVWDLNKNNLTKGLSIIHTFFPHYSDHDFSHSMTVINNIECFLGEERIKRLGATDTFLLLMAGLTHDIGMVLTHKIIEREWKDEKFRKKLELLAYGSDSSIAEAAKLILRYHRQENDAEPSDFSWALDIRNAVIYITAELFRKKHAQLGAANLVANEEFMSLTDNLYFTQLPTRFMELLANIAHLHGEDFEKVMTCLYAKANGYKRDDIHPRFIACMIRLGDLLDVDSNRFNSYSLATLGQMPESSRVHLQKHASVKHLLISPNAIEIKMDCAEEEVYRIAMELSEMLEQEVQKQSREWTHIAPENLGGLPPVISKNSVQILYNGIQVRPELLHLRFVMPQEKIFNLLQGGSIYEEPSLVFIREIVQNALDATKIQLWKDINKGVYHSCPEPAQILFPDDIDKDIYNHYPIILRIKWKDEKKTCLRIECEDRGTGISEEELLRMTKYVGESRKADSGYIDLCEKMPYWLRPTATFGVGLQSIFYVASAFEVETYYEGEVSRRIIFRSPADKQYSSIVAKNVRKNRGTRVCVDIPQSRFRELFGNYFTLGELKNVDMFKGTGDNPYLAKLDYFVRETFEGIENMNFRFETENSDRCFCRCHVDHGKRFECPESLSDYKYLCHVEHNVLFFEIYEKEIGATLKIWFDTRYDYRKNDENKRLRVQDIIVSKADMKRARTSRMCYDWNLNNQEVDRMLHVSRDKLTQEGKQWVANVLLEKILPKILPLFNDSFKEAFKEEGCDKVSLKSQYLNYCLTLYAFQLPRGGCIGLEQIQVPIGRASRNRTMISAKEFFDAQELLLVRSKGNNDVDKRIREIVENDSRVRDNIIIWEKDFFHSSLKYHYVCSEIIHYGDDYQMFKLTLKDEKQGMGLVKCCAPRYLRALERMPRYSCFRSTIYAVDRYQQIVVTLNNTPGFKGHQPYASCFIFSPFKTQDQIDELRKEVAGKKNSEIYNIVKKKIGDYIPPLMLSTIKTANIDKDVTENQILDTYVELICDYIGKCP